MPDYAREALSLVQGRGREELDTDRQLNLALVRLLEIVGEATARVPEEERLRLPEIPWSQIISLRNRLIHGYDDVDPDIIWNIVTRNLPSLVKALKEALRSGIME